MLQKNGGIMFSVLKAELALSQPIQPGEEVHYSQAFVFQKIADFFSLKDAEEFVEDRRKRILGLYRITTEQGE